MDLAYEEISQELETRTVNHRRTVLSQGVGSTGGFRAVSPDCMKKMEGSLRKTRIHELDTQQEEPAEILRPHNARGNLGNSNIQERKNTLQ